MPVPVRGFGRLLRDRLLLLLLLPLEVGIVGLEGIEIRPPPVDTDTNLGMEVEVDKNPPPPPGVKDLDDVKDGVEYRGVRGPGEERGTGACPEETEGTGTAGRSPAIPAPTLLLATRCGSCKGLTGPGVLAPALIIIIVGVVVVVVVEEAPVDSVLVLGKATFELPPVN